MKFREALMELFTNKGTSKINLPHKIKVKDVKILEKREEITPVRGRN
jgi:hypothetical protein